MPGQVGQNAYSVHVVYSLQLGGDRVLWGTLAVLNLFQLPRRKQVRNLRNGLDELVVRRIADRRRPKQRIFRRAAVVCPLRHATDCTCDMQRARKHRTAHRGWLTGSLPHCMRPAARRLSVRTTQYHTLPHGLRKYRASSASAWPSATSEPARLVDRSNSEPQRTARMGMGSSTFGGARTSAAPANWSTKNIAARMSWQSTPTPHATPPPRFRCLSA